MAQRQNLIAQALLKFGFAWGPDPVQPDRPDRNLTGDPYYTDGLRAA